MHYKLILSLFNLAVLSASAIPTEAVPEQAAGTLDDIQIGVPKMIKPKYRENAKRAIIRYPAFTLSAKGRGGFGSLDSAGQSGFLRIGQGMCSKCTLLSAHYRVVLPSGKEATPKDGVYIHHMISFLAPKTSSSPIGGISIGGIGSALGAAYFIDRGEDSGQTDTIFTSPDGKFDSGYQINGPPSITVSWDMVNYDATPKQLHLELEYEYVDGIVGKDAGHTLQTVMGLPKLNGKSSSMNMRISRPTTIMWARGHLHSGGEKMVMKVNGDIKCTSNPTYDSKGIITEMSLCPRPIPLQTGDTMVIESFYDTNKHKLRQSTDGSGKAAHGVTGSSDVMGMFAMSYTT